MTFFYNVAYFVFAVVYLPHFFSKMKQADNPRRLIAQRLGFFSKERRRKLEGKKIVWLHAVSVGEVLALEEFIERFLSRATDLHLVLTTVTPTGQRIAKKMEGDRVTVCYFPFDFTASVRNFFKVLKPRCLLLAETEIWPNLLVESGRAGVPVGILNARLSPKSARWYRLFPFFFKPLFQRLDFVLAQTDADAERFAELGVDPEKIEVMGNMKFDNVSLEPLDGYSRRSLRREWGFDEEDPIFIAGSTHPGEEKILRNVFQKLRQSLPTLKMILAPRHIERSQVIQSAFEKQGLRMRLASEGKNGEIFDVLLLNQMGILKNLYAVADAVFMGGSLIRKGGQNPIEPASFKRAILHGPHVLNFNRVYQLLDQEGAALEVRDETQLAFALKRLLENENERTRLGENAFALLEKLQGATERTLERLFDLFEPASQSERTNHVKFHEKLFPSAGRRP